MKTLNFDEQLNLNGMDIRISTHSGKSNSIGMHCHHNTSIVLILQGGCVEKRKHTNFERTITDILFLHAGEMHETIITQWPTKYISLNIDAILLDNCEMDEAQLMHTMATIPDAKFLMLRIYHEFLKKDTFTVDSVQMLFMQYASLSNQIKYKAQAPKWVKTIHELLHDSWNEPVSLDDLAKATGVSPITISKHFPYYFASTLGTYRRKLKIEHSLAIIKKEGVSLTEAAYTCNFADQSHFIRTFKEVTSLSPKQYKKL